MKKSNNKINKIARAYDMQNGIALERKNTSKRAIKKICHEAYNTPYRFIKVVCKNLSK